MSEAHTEDNSLCMAEIGCSPDVRGYRLLIKAPEIPEKKGNIILSDSYRQTQERRQNIGLVLAMGPSAFTGSHEDKKCSVGDWVHYSILEREPVYPNGKACFYINDDKIIAILKPEEVFMFLDEKK